VELKQTFSIQEVRKSYFQDDFYAFVQYFWDTIIPEEPVWNWHMEYICEELQIVAERVLRGEVKEYDLIINVPPATSKSTLCTIMLPVWLWTRDASLRCMTASYSGSLSQDHSIKSRDIIRSEKFQELYPEIVIRRDIDNKSTHKNTEGGERKAVSVGGSTTGFHSHILIVDDPQSPKKANSEKEREQAVRFMDQTLSTRKIDKNVTPTILVMQRLHANDATGNWLKQAKEKGKKIKHICLPAEVSSNIKPEYVKENYKQGLLDPQRLNRDALSDLKASLGSYGYAGQMMQTPSPDGGGIVKAEWFQVITRTEFEVKDIKLKNHGTDWDTAYTKKEQNSASAYVSSGVWQNDMYITDLGFRWLEFPELIKWMSTRRHPHYIEAKASGKSLKQVLKSRGIPAIEVNVPDSADKISKTTKASPYIEAGMVYIFDDLLEKLLHDEKQGILMFPNGEYDDLIDALVQAIFRHLVKARPKIRNSSVR
jgi:predicted phage terminase large subunit-like protein